MSANSVSSSTASAFRSGPAVLLRRLVLLFNAGLDALRSPAQLLARLFVAKVFFVSGLTKIRDWETTVALFTDEYQVPLLSPGVAALMGTTGELLLPVLLVFGLGGRFAALGLSVVNVVAVISVADMAPAAFGQHLLWGTLLAGLAIWGPGRWSVDGWIATRWGGVGNDTAARTGSRALASSARQPARHTRTDTA